jgi:hypothetical protein
LLNASFLHVQVEKPEKGLDFSDAQFSVLGVFFLLAFLIGLYSIRRLPRAREIGEVEEGVVVWE